MKKCTLSTLLLLLSASPAHAVNINLEFFTDRDSVGVTLEEKGDPTLPLAQFFNLLKITPQVDSHGSQVKFFELSNHRLSLACTQAPPSTHCELIAANGLNSSDFSLIQNPKDKYFSIRLAEKSSKELISILEPNSSGTSEISLENPAAGFYVRTSPLNKEIEIFAGFFSNSL